MAPLKFYHSPLSHNSLRVEMVLVEKKIEYESVTVDLIKGEQNSPEMLAKAPWGKVPILECPHAGPIYESRPIARYLATTYSSNPPSLIPSSSDLPALARFEEGLAVEATSLDPDVTQLFFQRALAPLMGMTPDEALIEKSRKKIAEVLGIVDGILGKQRYMGGAEFGLADISFLPEFLALVVTGEDKAIKENKNVERWWKEVGGRESWKKVSAPVWETYEGIKQKANVQD